MIKFLEEMAERIFLIQIAILRIITGNSGIQLIEKRS